MDDLDDGRRGETTSSVFKRLSVGSRSSRNENSKVEDVRSNKRERDSRDKSRENNKKTINGDKGDIGGLARRLSKASATESYKLTLEKTGLKSVFGIQKKLLFFWDKSRFSRLRCLNRVFTII